MNSNAERQGVKEGAEIFRTRHVRLCRGDVVTMNHSLSSPPPSAPIEWIDSLRVLACFLVVLAHCCDPFVGNAAQSMSDFRTGAIWGSLVRPCVPLFAMISGALLLPVRMEMGAFYKRRLKRVAIPLVVWSLALPLMFYAYFAFVTHGVHTANPNIEPGSYTWAATAAKLYTFLFNFNYDTTPLWYLYMLVGLYLFMPVISGWLNQASRKDVKIFLGIWVFSMIIPGLQMFAPSMGYEGNYGNMGLWGVCDWNPYGMFYNFAGFLGYIVLGWYLIKYPLAWSRGKTIAMALLMLIAGYAATLWGFFAVKSVYPDQAGLLEIPWYFSGINVFAMTVAVFIVMRKLAPRRGSFVARLAGWSFGIYLCHFVFVQAAYDACHGLPLPAWVQIPLMACVAFAISALFVGGLGALKKYVPVLKNAGV